MTEFFMSDFKKCPNCGKEATAWNHLGNKFHFDEIKKQESVRIQCKHCGMKTNDFYIPQNSSQEERIKAEKKAIEQWNELEGYENRCMEISNLILAYGMIEGEHHKQWLIDNIVRVLKGDDYNNWVKEMYEDGYEWDAGIAP